MDQKPVPIITLKDSGEIKAVDYEINGIPVVQAGLIPVITLHDSGATSMQYETRYIPAVVVDVEDEYASDGDVEVVYEGPSLQKREFQEIPLD